MGTSDCVGAIIAPEDVNICLINSKYISLWKYLLFSFFIGLYFDRLSHKSYCIQYVAIYYPLRTICRFASFYAEHYISSVYLFIYWLLPMQKADQTWNLTVWAPVNNFRIYYIHICVYIYIISLRGFLNFS